MARTDQSGDWARRFSPSLEELDSLVRSAYSHLPDNFRGLCGEIVIQLVDFPDEQTIEDMGLESEFDLLGLFEGTSIGERLMSESGDEPNRITLFRRAILDYWSENQETLGDIVTHILIYEIGHHFGLSDDEMEAIEGVAE